MKSWQLYHFGQFKLILRFPKKRKELLLHQPLSSRNVSFPFEALSTRLKFFWIELRVVEVLSKEEEVAKKEEGLNSGYLGLMEE